MVLYAWGDLNKDEDGEDDEPNYKKSQVQGGRFPQLQFRSALKPDSAKRKLTEKGSFIASEPVVSDQTSEADVPTGCPPGQA